MKQASSAADVLQNLDPNVAVDQLKELLQTPFVKSIGGELQLRLVATWTDSGYPNRLDLFNDLLPLIDLKSIRDAAILNIMVENYAILGNAQCRNAWSTID